MTKKAMAHQALHWAYVNLICSIVVDQSLDSLLHLHERSSYHAKNGSHGNVALGSQGPLK